MIRKDRQSGGEVFRDGNGTVSTETGVLKGNTVQLT